MLSVRAQVDIAVSPERVWRVLINFAHYRKWHPFVELEGSPSLGGDIDFYFRRNPKAPRGWRVRRRSYVLSRRLTLGSSLGSLASLRSSNGMCLWISPAAHGSYTVPTIEVYCRGLQGACWASAFFRFTSFRSIAWRKVSQQRRRLRPLCGQRNDRGRGRTFAVIGENDPSARGLLSKTSPP